MKRFVSVCLGLWLSVCFSLAHVNDGRQFAIEAGLPQLDLTENPFQLREHWWEGELAPNERKVIQQQLFQGNEYWFWVGVSDETQAVSVHIYDAEGNLVEEESFARDQVAGARVLPQATGSYYIVVTAAKDNVARETVIWGMVYAYR